MNIKSLVRYMLFTLVMLIAVPVCEVQSSDIKPPGHQQRRVSKKPPSANKKTAKIKRSKSVRKVVKKQADNDKRLKKEYEEFVRNNQKRSLEIQTPEVRERMKQNMKDSNNNFKSKKKTETSRSRKAGRKYR